MPAGRAELLVCLEELGIKTTTVEHPPLFTVEESQRLRGQIPGKRDDAAFRHRVDRSAATFNRACDSAHQARGMQAGVFPGEQAAADFCDSDALLHLFGAE